MKLLILFFVILFFSSSYANQLLDINFEGQSEKRSQSEARKEVFDNAINEVSLKYIKEIIGEQKTEKSKSIIANKIIKDYLKYIPILKTTDLKREEGKFKINLALKLSIDNLKKMLLREGLLYKSDGPPKVLPMISFVDRVNSQSHSWWSQKNTAEKVFISEMNLSFNKKLKSELMKRGFYAVSPHEFNMGELLPDVFKQDRPRTEDYLFMGRFFDSSIVVKGDVKFLATSRLTDSYAIHVRLQAIQTSNGRVIGEVIRKYNAEPGSFGLTVSKKFKENQEALARDLSVQVLDAWQKGTFGASLIKLTLRGRLNYQQLTDFKRLVLRQVRSISGLRERMMASGRYTFEIDSSSSTKELAKSFKRQKFPKFKVEVDDIEGDELALNIKTR